MKKTRVRILDLGNMTFSKKELVRTPDEAAMIVSPAQAVLIEHHELGRILYDTGNDEAWEATYSDDMKDTYPITKLVGIEEALAKEGLTVDDIDLLILSHLHFDHAGGLRHFEGTRAGGQVMASETELHDALYKAYTAPGGISGAYIRPLYCLPGISFQPVPDEGMKLADDLVLFVQKCHTAGLVGMRVKLDGGWVIFCSDTVYTREAYEQQLPPGGAINETDDEFFENLKLLKIMEQTYQAEVFFGHDIDQATAWQAKGWIE